MSYNSIPLVNDIEEQEELPEFRELARDLSNLNLLTKANRFYTVSKNDALKIWILKVLHRENVRYEHRAYSNNYGNEITKLFGRHLKDSLLKSELKRYTEEALLVNPYIKRLSNFSYEKKGSKVNLSFTVFTVYGEFEQNVVLEQD